MALAVTFVIQTKQLEDTSTGYGTWSDGRSVLQFWSGEVRLKLY